MQIKNNTDISKFVVAQSNNLVEAHYSTELTAHAHKIARLILSFISPDDADMRTYTIPLSALKQYLGVSSDSRRGAFYDRLKETSKKLNKQPIEIKQKNGDTIVASFLSGYKISPREGKVTFEISSLLKPFLLDLRNNYTSYLLANIPKLKSGYSIRVYELLYQYKRIGKRTFELGDLQKKVGSDYTLYGDFKRKVLKQAQKDLKIYTDLNFIFAEIKTGRKVTSIEFVIFGNVPKSKDTPQLSLLEDALELKNEVETPALSENIIKQLNKLGINEQNISKYLAKGFGIIVDAEKRKIAEQRCSNLNNYYLEKLELTKLSNTNNNPAGFLVKALKEDWVNGKTKNEEKKKEYLAKQKKQRQQLAALEKQKESLIKQQKNMREPILSKLLNDETKFEPVFKEAKEQDLKNNVRFIKANLSPLENYHNSMFVSSQINAIFEKKHPQLFVESNKVFDEIKQVEREIKKAKKLV
jgi:plasmid replication initiation protein